MRHSESLDQIAPALVKARNKMTAVHKDASNPHFKSKFASLEAITESVMPHLIANGVTVLQGAGQQDDAGVEVVTRLLHVSGQWIETGIRLPLDKPNAQGAGSAVSYGRRYGLAAILGVVTEEDDDGNAASASARPAARPAQSSRPPAGNAVMPFGKTKGTLLADMAIDDLEGAYLWAKEKGKFEEFQREAEAEMSRRTVPAKTGFEAMPDALLDDGPPLWG